MLSHISKVEIGEGEAIEAHDLREGIFQLIKLAYPRL